MIAKALPKGRRRRFFDLLSRSIGLRDIEMDIDARKLGAQIQACWTGRPAMSYDPRHGAFRIMLGNLCHQISPVRDIFISESNGRLEGVDVIEPDGTRHAIRLRDPLNLLALPAPARRVLPANSRASIRTVRGASVRMTV